MRGIGRRLRIRRLGHDARHSDGARPGAAATQGDADKADRPTDDREDRRHDREEDQAQDDRDDRNDVGRDPEAVRRASVTARRPRC